MRDGREYGARVCWSLEEALAFLGEAATTWFANSNYEFKLFELGKELPLDRIDTEEQVKVSSVKHARFSVRRGGDKK